MSAHREAFEPPKNFSSIAEIKDVVFEAILAGIRHVRTGKTESCELHFQILGADIVLRISMNERVH